MRVRHSLGGPPSSRRSGVVRWMPLVLGFGFASSPVRAAAQDIEMTAHALRRAVPASYYQRLRSNPRFFQWPDVWSPAASLTAARSAVTPPPRSGILPILVVPVLFADSPAPGITDQDLQQTLFDGPAAFGTIPDVYREISGGRLQLQGRVLPWLRSTLTLQQALGSESGFGIDSRLGEYLRDALQGADPLVDYGQFDNNGPDGIPNSGDDNGIVDIVVVLFLERALPCGGTGPWPHLSGYGAWFPEAVFATQDARRGGGQIATSGYIMLSASACTGNGITTPAILAHELGHTLGLPDLYDASSGLGAASRRWVVGCWDLMGAGAWGCGDGSAAPTASRPTHYGAWSKDRMGWLNVTDVGSVRDQEFVLHAAHLSNEALRVTLSPGERFLVEYRERSGYDRELAASGVVVWHIDDSATGDPTPGIPTLYPVMLEEADGNRAMLKLSSAGGNRGEAGDVFGQSGAARFSAATNPAARRHDGRATTFTIHSIDVDTLAHLARLRVTTDAVPSVVTPPLAPWPALVTEQRALHLSGGAEPYTLSVSGQVPKGLSFSVQGDSLLVRGAPVQAGSFAARIDVTDALGTFVARQLTLVVTEPAFTLAHLLEPFLQGDAPPLPASEAEYLDTFGNANGRFDVGDLRAYVRAKKPS